MVKYGVAYMGGKNSIAEQIVNLLTAKENLYDLFCGGGAITYQRNNFIYGKIK